MLFYMKKTSLFNFSFVLFCLVFHSGVHAEKLNTTSAGKPVELETLIEKQGVIWGFEFLPNDQIIFSEREGSLKIFNLKNKKVILVEGTPEYVSFGQGGLMDIHLDPNFKKNKKLYLTYAVKVGENHTTRVSSAVLNENKLTELKQIFQATPGTKNTVHFGSRLQIDDKGFLFISIGDRGERNLAQDLNTHLGKILRIRTDGTIPEDNPFYGKKDHKPEIWSYGHRNPQGLFFDKETKILWAQEHGPRGGDEINIIEKGKNYGWPKATYGKEYWGPKIGKTHVEGTVQPVYQFTPSIAPGGLLIYKGDHFPKWKNSIFSAALAIPQLNRLYKVGSDYREESLLTELAKRMRHVKEDAQGYIYISTDSGEIYRLK
jgi:glucose/arabinose dehydrogenase